ncbi:5-hydroxyisourate hydrolase [Paraglaciecola mesophila]|uniref:5-hydroxyisourate hydrolase n=1 Tax=Paraglaciecola mesophila TaxID=197222 RepID=A0A857JDD8_9ALTE|nr:hydroxyisourate hydrolase [Paraglaciecola mesophila]QHJ10039.1 5-hydroxyisourate hydrolase [Paraglaciecola mesophila]
MSKAPSLSSHVLDTTLGKPAANMQLILTTPEGNIAHAQTDADGRCNQWGELAILPGLYQLRFITGEYLSATHGSAFYPFVDVHFEITKEGGHYHIPLLISPFGFSSYRGS